MKIFQAFTNNAVVIIKNDGIGVIPTDTIYGIVAPLFSKNAVERIFVAKNRPQDKRVGTILISSPDQINKYVDSKKLFMAQTFWPGPVSVELPVVHSLEYAHRGNGTLAFRMPNDQELLDFIAKTGPLASSSANIADGEPSVDINQAMKIFGSKVDFYIDKGDLSDHQPSKIIKIHDNGEIEVIREG